MPAYSHRTWEPSASWWETWSPLIAGRSAAPLDPSRAPRDHQMHYNRPPRFGLNMKYMCILRLYLFSLRLLQEGVLDHSGEILEKSPLFVLIPSRTLNRLWRTLRVRFFKLFILVPPQSIFILDTEENKQDMSSVSTCSEAAGRWTNQTRYSLLDKPIFLIPGRLCSQDFAYMYGWWWF